MLLNLRIDPNTGVPAYRQIIDQFRLLIGSGRLRKGDLAPSVRELSRELKINPATVIKAYSELEHEGLLRIRHGAGAFVEGQSRLPNREKMKALRAAALPLVSRAKQLGVSLDETIDVVRETFTGQCENAADS